MIFNNYEAAFYTILLLVPGFIMNMGYAYLVPQREGQAQLFMIRYIVFSCIIYSLVWPFVNKLIQTKYWTNHPFRWSLILIFILLVLPYLLGLIIGIINGRDWIRKLLRKIKINPIHPSPTAWDFVMPGDPRYVIITLKNQTEIYGLYADGSLASSVPTDKDIYLQQIYKVGKFGTWNEVNRGKGMWVNGSEILHIEFLDAKEEEDIQDGVQPEES